MVLRILWVLILALVLGFVLWFAWTAGGVLTGLIVAAVVIPALYLGARAGTA
jgi:hypothetical protein